MGAAALPAMVPDLVALKTRQQSAWSSGDYAVVGSTLQIVGETLCEALDLNAGQRVLDVAAGNGNVALAAARRGCDVVATDYVISLLDRARLRATADGLPMQFQVADAEALPFGEEEFDAVVSTFGVMFTADHARAAAELLRVCRPGGKIGLANWTPEGFIGQVFKVFGKHVPPPAAARSPAVWGTRNAIVDFFHAQATSIKVAERTFTFRYRSPSQWLDVFRTYYGPMLKAFAALPAPGQEALERDLLALVDTFNRAGDGSMSVPGEYLEVVVTRA
jgi:SAM-dependent methyltransferase